MPDNANSLSSAVRGQSNGTFWDALQGIKKFYDAKAGTASNDVRYKKALIEAGVPAEDTGVGD